MSNTGKSLSRKELNIKTKFIERMWTYLDSNFSKFSKPNQLKIALELVKKNIPQTVEGDIRYTAMSMIRIEQKPMDLDIGEIPKDVQERMQ